MTDRYNLALRFDAKVIREEVAEAAHIPAMLGEHVQRWLATADDDTYTTIGYRAWDDDYLQRAYDDSIARAARLQYVVSECRCPDCDLILAKADRDWYIHREIDLSEWPIHECR